MVAPIDEISRPRIAHIGAAIEEPPIHIALDRTGDNAAGIVEVERGPLAEIKEVTPIRQKRWQTMRNIAAFAIELGDRCGNATIVGYLREAATRRRRKNDHACRRPGSAARSLRIGQRLRRTAGSIDFF